MEEITDFIAQIKNLTEIIGNFISVFCDEKLVAVFVSVVVVFAVVVVVRIIKNFIPTS